MCTHISSDCTQLQDNTQVPCTPTPPPVQLLRNSIPLSLSLSVSVCVYSFRSWFFLFVCCFLDLKRICHVMTSASPTMAESEGERYTPPAAPRSSFLLWIGATIHLVSSSFFFWTLWIQTYATESACAHSLGQWRWPHIVVVVVVI